MRLGLVLIAATMLAGCSANESASRQSGESSPIEVAEVAPPGDGKGAEGTEQVKVSLPQLAYSYALGFVLPSDRIAEAQDAHRALCERMGPARCQLLAMERGSGTERDGSATMKLRVATVDARMFSDSLTQSVRQAGGRAEKENVTAEDVSKQVTDTATRIRQRELLVARLTDILRSRRGSTAQLVEAERSVAQAQEELDQAKAWLRELQGRVAMSDFDLRYAAIAPSTSPGSTAGLLGEAAQGSAAAFMIGLRGVLSVAIYLAPWLLLIGGIAWVVRRVHRSYTRGEHA